jgi:hypothetical protein
VALESASAAARRQAAERKRFKGLILSKITEL